MFQSSHIAPLNTYGTGIMDKHLNDDLKGNSKPKKKRYSKAREKQLRFLRQSIRLEESFAPHSIRRAALCVAVLVWLFVGWMFLTKIEEITHASGEVIPNGFTQIVQHYEGGIVKAIHTQEGNLVTKGDLLIVLDGAGAQEELNKAVIAYEGYKNDINVARQMLEIRQGLFAKGMSSKVLLLEAERNFTQADSRLEQQKEVIARLKGSVNRLEVRAPVTGLVKGLNVNTIGAVIKSGDPLMEILPVEENLVVETQISPRDIGHVSIGQPVRVKVSSYDYGRFGMVDGTLNLITATTFSNKNGEKFYRGRVILSKNYVGHNPNHKILPGMTVQAGIITGEKSIFEYLVKPVQWAFSGGLTER